VGDLLRAPLRERAVPEERLLDLHRLRSRVATLTGDGSLAGTPSDDVRLNRLVALLGAEHEAALRQAFGRPLVDGQDPVFLELLLLALGDAELRAFIDEGRNPTETGVPEESPRERLARNLAYQARFVTPAQLFATREQVCTPVHEGNAPVRRVEPIGSDPADKRRR
jgi:hypothetical protein